MVQRSRHAAELAVVYGFFGFYYWTWYLFSVYSVGGCPWLLCSVGIDWWCWWLAVTVLEVWWWWLTAIGVGV